MNSSDFYTETLKLQRQAAQEQTKIITEIKTLVSISGAEQAKALAAGFEKLSKAVGSIVIPAASVQPASQNSATVIQIISYSYPQMIYWYGRWWYWDGSSWV